MQRRPRLLISNDDGINAPGLKSLVSALVAADFAEICIVAPSGERSAQSHAITLGRYMMASPAESPGVAEAWAVDGTPADSVMLALHSPLLQNNTFDLVLSGINRGDNAGMHVIYSGTVGAAREAACKGLPAIAFSLDNHLARKQDDYALAARLAVILVRATLGLLQQQQNGAAGSAEPPVEALRGHVVNINFPIAQGQVLQGMYLTQQSLNGVFPAFKEVQEASGPHLAEIDEHTPDSRVFRNYAGPVQEDDTEGGDGWAIKRGWVSVTPLGLRSDVFRSGAGSTMEAQNEAVRRATSSIVVAAAAEAGLAAGGVSKL